MDPVDTNKVSLNKQIQHAFCMLAQSMYHSDSALFIMPLSERLQTSKSAKLVWLEDVQIAANDYTNSHGRTPGQQKSLSILCRDQQRKMSWISCGKLR
eukprot:4751868-Ditylum_brightwellii.AAC.1